MRVNVEFDIFSGLPNPSWDLGEADAASFERLLDALPTVDGGGLSGRLGYRGFIVQMASGGATRLVRVQGGRVEVTEGALATYRKDAGRALERWLLASGRAHLKPDLYTVAERDLG